MKTKQTTKKSGTKQTTKAPATTTRAQRAAHLAAKVAAARATKATKPTPAARVTVVADQTTKAAPPAERAARVTVSSVARDLILAGKTNEEVLVALQKQFGLDPETKGTYPAWYRAQLVRDGKLTKAQAAATRH